MTKQDKVKQWMELFGQQCPDSPTMVSQQVQYLRWKLIMEEGKELADANNLTDALDAVADLLYVVYGAAIAFGFSREQVDAAFDDVHRSNLSKFWTEAEVNDHCMDGMKVKKSISNCGEREYVVLREDGKVVKSPSYSPADLAAILLPKSP